MSICETGTSPEVNIPMREPGRIDQLRRDAEAVRDGLDRIFGAMDDNEAVVFGREAYVRLDGYLARASVVANVPSNRPPANVVAESPDSRLLSWLLVNAIYRDEWGRWKWAVGEENCGFNTFRELEDAQNHMIEHFGLTK